MTFLNPEESYGMGSTLLVYLYRGKALMTDPLAPVCRFAFRIAK